MLFLMQFIKFKLQLNVIQIYCILDKLNIRSDLTLIYYLLLWPSLAKGFNSSCCVYNTVDSLSFVIYFAFHYVIVVGKYLHNPEYSNILT